MLFAAVFLVLLYVDVDVVVDADDDVDIAELLRFLNFRNSVSNQCNDINNPVDSIVNMIIWIRATFITAAQVVNTSKHAMTNRTNGSNNKPPPGSMTCDINDAILVCASNETTMCQVFVALL